MQLDSPLRVEMEKSTVESNRSVPKVSRVRVAKFLDAISTIRVSEPRKLDTRIAHMLNDPPLNEVRL
ncbi:jg1539 [Pararge aegeria aegeria]|uniref:Jg1539 protein n=1 Tax=Pararge aegeria aegeria TaxID=348720 RepID=A0A8S4RGD2_9NEOP|nr:jg1539 [Pararge aegeria aegeria]